MSRHERVLIFESSASRLDDTLLATDLSFAMSSDQSVLLDHDTLFRNKMQAHGHYSETRSLPLLARHDSSPFFRHSLDCDTIPVVLVFPFDPRHLFFLSTNDLYRSPTHILVILSRTHTVIYRASRMSPPPRTTAYSFATTHSLALTLRPDSSLAP